MTHIFPYADPRKWKKKERAWVQQLEAAVIFFVCAAARQSAQDVEFNTLPFKKKRLLPAAVAGPPRGNAFFPPFAAAVKLM